MKTLTLLQKIIGGVGLVAIIALVVWIWVLNVQVSSLRKEDDNDLVKEYELLENKYNSLQAERDSLADARKLWVVERDSLINRSIEVDSQWHHKESYYEELHNDIVRDGTLVDVTVFLSNH